jgi:glucokinase
VTAERVVGALDIGGTHVAAARVDLAAAALEPRSRVSVPLREAGDRAELLDALSVAAEAIARPDIALLGVSVPGPFDYPAGVSRISHKLEGLYGVDLRSELGATLGLPDPAAVRFVNDAEAFLLGEWWAGAAGGHTRAVGITLGTGLGAAFMEDARIVRSGAGVPPGGALYELEYRGLPVERTISRGGILARYGSPAEERIDVEQIASRAREGERAASEVFEEVGQALGEFLTPWLRAFQPTCLVVGGSIARAWDLLEGSLRAELGDVERLGTVTVAEQLDDAPLLGAARHAVSARP